MEKILVYNAGTGGAAPFASKRLIQRGIAITEHPQPEITHLLLDLPCRQIPEGLLERLPEKITVTGGHLDRPELQGYRKLDLLKHEDYLAANAAITAECALRTAGSRMRSVFRGSSALVIGWGRIGKCLARLLQGLGCIVTVAVRSRSQQAILKSLGYASVDILQITRPEQYDLIFNTVPAPVLSTQDLSKCAYTLKIDLASTPGLEGSDVIHARGLPGLYAPESSGKLIADTLIKEVTS